VVKGSLRPEFVFQFIFLFHVIVFHPHLLGASGCARTWRANHSRHREVGEYADSWRWSFRDECGHEGTSQYFDGCGRQLLVAIPADGGYTVRVQMAAFAVGTQEVVLDATHQDVPANFELVLLSRAREAGTKKTGSSAGECGRTRFSEVFPCFKVKRAGCGRWFGGQFGSSMSDVAPAGMPVPGIAPNGATESVAVSGNTSNSFNTMSADQMQQRFDDARQQGGGFGGGFGGFREVVGAAVVSGEGDSAVRRFRPAGL
jgi:hypothetical protein